MKRKWTFDDGPNKFSYRDDVFRFTDEPRQAAGRHAPGGGHEGGALVVRLGGDGGSAEMSGAWGRGFTLEEAQPVTLSFRYRIDQPADYGARDLTDVRVKLDGEEIGVGGRARVDRLFGDGPGGERRTTGWEKVTIELGELDAGRHGLKLGGFGRGPADAVAKIVFDDVKLATTTPRLAAFEAEVLALTNEFRAEHGLDPLRNDAKLNAAAEDWSLRMAEGDFFRHSTPAQVERFGYDWQDWGENIAAGQTSPEAVVEGWIDSPGHRRNLLSEDFEEIGIGYYYRAGDGGDASYGHYWTQAFGTEADSLV